jgi:hypothetical protein
VALIALYGSMTPIERVARLRVVEFGNPAGPPDQIEIAAGMFRVASCAVALTSPRVEDARMISPVVFHPLLNVHMTRKTLQLRASSPKGVATHAFQRPFQRLMGPG